MPTVRPARPIIDKSIHQSVDDGTMGCRNSRTSPAMETTPNLALPYIMPAQAQKHVTHNEAIRTLDALVQLVFLDRHRSAPPAEPSEGDAHVVADASSGAWAGHDGHIAIYQDGAWTFHLPKHGWHGWSIMDQRLIVWDGSAWGVVDRPGPIAGAFAYSFNTDVNMGDPGPGQFRLNNSTAELSTACSLAADLADGSDVAAMIIARFNTSAAVQCRMVVAGPDIRLEFDATAITDQSGWLQATIQNGVISGSVANGTNCEIVFEWRA